MLFIALLAIFGAAALATSALAYDELRWRYAAGVTVACAVILAAWTTELLVAATLHQVSWDIPPLVAILIAVVPYAVVVSNLWTRRRHTPRHAPGIDHDPCCAAMWRRNGAGRGFGGRPKRRRRQPLMIPASREGIRHRADQ